VERVTALRVAPGERVHVTVTPHRLLRQTVLGFGLSVRVVLATIVVPASRSPHVFTFSFSRQPKSFAALRLDWAI
jgi:hypothetical protein